MHFVITLLLTLTSFAHAEIIRVRPQELSLIGDIEDTDAGELFIKDGEPAFNGSPIAEGISFFSRRSQRRLEKMPLIESFDHDSSGSRRPYYRVGPGKVFINNKFYTNESAIFCGTLTDGPGGYDTTNPFAGSSMAFGWLYLIPDGSGFNCIIGPSPYGPNSHTSWKRISTLQYYSSWLYPLTNVISKNGNTELGSYAGFFWQVNLARTTACQAISYSSTDHYNFSEIVDSADVQVSGSNGDFATLTFYEDSSCTVALLNLASGTSVTVADKLPGSYFKTSALYVKGTTKTDVGATYLNFIVSKFRERIAQPGEYK